MATTHISSLTGKNEADLKGRLKELAGEGFKASFTTEPMTPAKAAARSKRKLEVAHINTVLAGRVAYDRAVSQLKAVEERLAKIGKASPDDPVQRQKLAAALRRKNELERTKAALAAIKGK
ncbi:MAG: hypothetical protein IT462_12115 [Planctomycetes bacterium]|nr:hypothetical protein [Planctomycetota bacterium]